MITRLTNWSGTYILNSDSNFSLVYDGNFVQVRNGGDTSNGKSTGYLNNFSRVDDKQYNVYKFGCVDTLF